MTTKKTNEKESRKEDSKIKKTDTAERYTLFDAVQNHEEQLFIIIGALSKEGLLDQYNHEKHAILTGTEDIAPSITMSQLDEIIKKFKGE